MKSKPSKSETPVKEFNPEYVDSQGLFAIFGIKRSLAYALMADGSIKSVSLTRPGQSRGKRLFDVESVRAFMRSQQKGA